MKTVSYFMALAKPREIPNKGSSPMGYVIWFLVFVFLIFGARMAFAQDLGGSSNSNSKIVIEGDNWKEIDPYQDFDKSYGEPEEFKAVRERLRLESELKKSQPISSHEKAESDLKALKEAEAKKQELDQKAKELELEKQRSFDRKARADRMKEEEVLRKDIRKKVEALPDVNEEELSWDGID